VIGYSINDLKGLSPAFCTHRIPMEDQCKPVVDHKRRLTQRDRVLDFLDELMHQYGPPHCIITDLCSNFNKH
jgi:hypothetical protein